MVLSCQPCSGIRLMASCSALCGCSRHSCSITWDSASLIGGSEGVSGSSATFVIGAE